MDNDVDVPHIEADPYRCTLNLSSPAGKEKILRKIISPLIKWIDPSFQIIRIFNSYLNSSSTCLNCRYDTDSASDFLRTPALSVMLFLSENGIMCSTEVQQYLKKRPWKFHHKVELQSRRTPDRPVACQEFYGLADDLPLWAVCPVHCGNEHLRFLFHVQNFREMVEFYRNITDVEMESNKPGFCIFQLYSQPGLDIQLALKHSNHIYPYPVKNAILNFKIKNLATIRTSIKSVITKIGPNVYSITDPDGNIVQLQEVLSHDIPKVQTNQLNMKRFSDDVKSVKSVRSSSDSHDSGRCSDSELWFSEVEKVDTLSSTMSTTHLSEKNKCADFNRMQKRVNRSTGDIEERGSTVMHQSKIKVKPVYL